jgi:hypothetical protein
MSALSRRDERLLVGLADGTLTGRRRRRAEERARSIPGAERLIARQQRVARALRAGLDEAPAPAAVSVRPAPEPRAPLRHAAAGALAAVLAACVAVAALVAPGADPPSPERVAVLSMLPATEPRPPQTGTALEAEVDGVRFPNWEPDFGWRTTGMRRDRLGDRDTATVYYEHHGHRLAYTIVAGPALGLPDGARIVERDGLRIALYRDPRHGGHDVAVFERDGHTCVVAGHVLEVETIVELSAWRGGGQVRS